MGEVNDFEFFFAFFALLLGLAVAEIAGGLATALGSRHRPPLVYLKFRIIYSLMPEMDRLQDKEL